ncbi:uncharacterized protein TRIADDRAFT_33595 [Trichoplax adhaerens]|uniref:DUF3456 domain-containing protein n=1 Tax=Trichoplax adhaerens TaxID=10228 RepID=B3SCX2_TRIAD|nr:hypothetical protein TRIADDRAFT_33595 [Trichoplax adhaerens]EDV19418.1 hypothetical protein TRIADDRAFT_33595 [Trichoplax adhaerens]|eukprot:XP_002118107.1 hypothetical protein TRIADDRAFT_33595 [Trichoplax adhaerens]
MFLNRIICNYLVCKYLAKEIEVETKKTSISKDVLHTGGFDTEFRNRKIPYETSEVRFIEILDNACENILKYRVHADKKERYLKGTSTTMNTLFGLKKRGVKVELGVPDEMWDDIPAEVSKMKRKCDAFREEFEDELMEWFLHYQKEDLMEWLCRMRALRPDQHGSYLQL